jgi:hypothetical protein
MLLEYRVKQFGGIDRCGYQVAAKIDTTSTTGWCSGVLAQALVKNRATDDLGCGGTFYEKGDGVEFVFEVAAIDPNDVKQHIQYAQEQFSRLMTEAMKVKNILTALAETDPKGKKGE